MISLHVANHPVNIEPQKSLYPAIRCFLAAQYISMQGYGELGAHPRKLREPERGHPNPDASGMLVLNALIGTDCFR